MSQAIITFIGVAVTALVTWSIAQRRIVVEHVTAERKRWRNKIRAKASKVHDAILADSRERTLRLRGEFRALLNPHDGEDRRIVACIEEGGGEEDRRERAEEFATRISLLLKHDWDRAKLEAGFFLFRWTLRVNRGGIEADAGKEGEELGGSLGRRHAGGSRRGFGAEWQDWWEKYSVRRWPALGLVLSVVFMIGVAVWWFEVAGVATSAPVSE